MDLKKYNENKIFVTGVTGSGKTTFALEYARLFNITYFNFDRTWTYNYTPDREYEKIVKKYPSVFVTDAIPYTIIDGKLLFMDYYNQHINDIKTVCCFCPDKIEYEKRVDVKFKKGDYIKPPNLFLTYHDFYYHTIKNIYSNFNMEYYDTITNEFVNIDEMYNRINWVKNLI